MKSLSKLTFVNCKRESKFGKPSIETRRAKLLVRVNEQINVAKAELEGKTFQVLQTKTVTNKSTGVSETRQLNKNIKSWFWKDKAGKLNCEVRYGSQTLALGKAGANAFQVANLQELVDSLQLIKTALNSGELDAAIESVVAARKAKSA